MPAPLSSSELPLWLGQRLSVGSPLYNYAAVFWIDGFVDSDRFRNAWRLLVEQQPVLRRAIVEVENSPVWTESNAAVETCEFLDFSQESDPEGRLRAWARDQCSQVLDIRKRLVRSVLVCVAPDRFGWLLLQHHLITDAVSIVLLSRAMSAAYAHLGRGEPVTPESVGLVRAPTLSGARAAPAPDSENDDYWRQKAATCPATPVYGTRRTSSRSATTRTQIQFGPEQARVFRSVCREDGFQSLFGDMALFTGWATVLMAWMHRVSGERTLGFVTPAPNRPTPALRRSLGLFIEMFPFGVSVEEGETFRSLGRKCGVELATWLRHVGPGRAPRIGVSTNVILNFLTGDVGSFAGQPWHVEWFHSGHADAARPVRLQVFDFEGRGAFQVVLDLNDELFPPTERDRAVAHFETVLREFLRDRDQSIASFDILTATERNQQLEVYNSPGGAPFPDRTVVDRFREQTRLRPEAIALRQGTASMSFATLGQRVDALAAALTRGGITEGSLVAVLATRSIETVVGVLALQAARAAYLPIDPAYPEGRVRQILEQSGVTFVLSSAVQSPALPSGPWRLRRFDDFESVPDETSSGGPKLGDTAYVIFTSGSTGVPKGVPITHGGLSDYLDWAEQQYVRGEYRTFPLFTSLAFDLTVTSLYLPLITGGTLVIYPETPGPVDGAFLAMMRENAVEVIKLTPSHLQLMRQLDLSGSRIRRMILGGEALPVALCDRIVRQLGRDVEIYNEYGPTEAVVGCMIHRFDPKADESQPSVPIGRPADHVRLYVVNEAGQLVPTGVSGELCIARYGLTAGYLGAETLTDERFVPSPWRAGDRLYRTGDLVRFIAPDCLTYLGRIDRQVKLSGHRVELPEIELALCRHPAIEQAAVCLCETDSRSGVSEHRQNCVRCGLSDDYPGTTFDEDGVCHLCRTFPEIKEAARAWFRPIDEFRERILAKRDRARSDFDCLLLLSGGKDSTYALSCMVEMGLRVLAFTLDNGYLSDEAKANIRRVVTTLGVEHEFGATPAMNAIFRDSLMRFSNVCNGCYKTIYTLGINRALELKIPVLVTGLSRGQFFETRLVPELFRGRRFTPDEVDRATLEARKAYHRVDDAVHRLLDVSAFASDRVFEDVEILDFYRFCDVSLAEMLAHLKRAVPWIRPADTGRSTNCLINDVGIHIHRKERGFHNYALPYSWDVRLGHKTREEAVDELEDDIDHDRVREILRTLDYDENRLAGSDGPPQMVAFYVAHGKVDSDELRRHALAVLPRPVVPNRWIRVDALPLTVNGKVDQSALAEMWSARHGTQTTSVGPPAEGVVEERVAAVWAEVLHCDTPSRKDDFFGLGGTSLGALEVMLRLCSEFELELELPSIFQHPTVEALAAVIEDQIRMEIEALSDEEARQLLAEERS